MKRGGVGNMECSEDGQPPDNSLPLEVGGQARVRELCGPRGMVHKVRSALRGVPYLPSLGQLAESLRVHLQVAVPRVVPRAGARLTVDIVHLALRCYPLLCRRDGGGTDERWGRNWGG